MQETDVSIAWIINAYQKPLQIIHLIDRICGPRDTVWLHYDKKSSRLEFDYIRNHYRSDARVHCVQKYRMYWGGVQIIRSDVLLGKQLLASNTEFDYVIHLTGTTYPIASDNALRQYLSANKGKTFVQLDPDERVHANGSERSRYFAKEHFGVTPGRNIPKYDALGKLPYKINLKRLRLLNRLGIGPGAVSLPKAFPEIYRGFVHNIIYRDHYRRVFACDAFSRFFKEMKHISCPDEVFFNTLLLNQVPRESLETTNNLLATYWEKSASPINLAMDDIDRLLKSGRYFARKFEDLDVIKTIDRILAEQEAMREPAVAPARDVPNPV